tara:strand:- start:729 stop:896 length:168 start_codon:yes stop_codon:yes gene_type:complete
MEKKYSVEEILDAINDLNNFKKNSMPKKNYNTTNSEDDDIPSNTLKLIEQAEGKS